MSRDKPEIETQYASATNRGAAGANVSLAAASAPGLGLALWRVKYALSEADVGELVAKLTRAIKTPGEAHGMARKIATIAVIEHVDPSCRTCGGKGVIINSERVHSSCAACSGTGLAAASEQTRVRALGCAIEAYQKKWKVRIEQAHNTLNAANYRTRSTILQGLYGKN